MKLRLRSLESKETLKLDVPNSCTLLQLKQTLSLFLPPSSSSSTSSIHFSLNRIDEIHASSPNDSLNSIGITNGDLVFYTLNPIAFCRKTLIHKPEDTTVSDAPSISEPEKSQTLDAAEAETMDLDYGSVEAVVTVGKRDSEPSFLRKVLIESIEDDVNDFKLFVFAVHAVFLESGFVLSDKEVDIRPSVLGSTMSIRYSLPEILNNNSSDIKTVILKFPTLGHFVNVYGSLYDVPGSGLPAVCLDKLKYARPLENLLNNSESKGDRCGKEIFEFWKMVKDRLALPLLIDLCEKAGLDPPPCFMRLPSELKFKILEYISGVDLAKVACVSRELRYLSSTNDLWELKIEEEFGEMGSGRDFGKMVSGGFCKEMFVLHWDSKKKAKQVSFRTRLPCPIRFIPGGYPTPIGILPILGGEFDWLPGLDLSLPSNRPMRTLRTFLPPCHLGGFDN